MTSHYESIILKFNFSIAVFGIVVFEYVSLLNETLVISDDLVKDAMSVLDEAFANS